MSYSNGFSVAVRVNGQFVGEKGNGECHIPFGSVYSLRFKNKHPRYAKVDVRIDGESVGAWEIAPNGNIDIHRPAHRDSAFQFASLDSAAAYAAGKGGDNPERVKGLIECVFSLEVPQPVVASSAPWVAREVSMEDIEEKTSGGISMASLGANATASPYAPVSDGCTVDGGMTGQQFGTSYRTFETMGTTIKVFLRGFISAPIVSPSPYPGSSVEAENLRLKNEIAAKKNAKAQQEKESRLEAENERLRQELSLLQQK